MITEDKVIEIFCVADDFCEVIDAKMAGYTPWRGEEMGLSTRFHHV